MKYLGDVFKALPNLHHLDLNLNNNPLGMYNTLDNLKESIK